MDDSVSFNVVNSNNDVPELKNVTDLIKAMNDHSVEDVHLNSKHGRSVILRNFYTDKILPHQYDQNIKPMRAYLNESLRKGLNAMGERAVYNQILESFL